MIPINPQDDFNQIVINNADWLLNYVKSLVKSAHIAEDLTQETFYRAYKNYAGYEEQGKVRAWLKIIARNTVYKYYNATSKITFVSMDAEESPIINMLVSREPRPEDKLVHSELVKDVLRLIAKLPKQQQMAVTYRYAHNMSIAETSRLMGLPEGTVKSNASYGIKALRKQLGIVTSKTKTETKQKGAKTMKTCNDFYGVLFEYAKGYLTKAERAEVETHTSVCTPCANKVHALAALWPYLQKELTQEGHKNYFSVVFQMDKNDTLSYTGMCSEFSEWEVNEFNKGLAANNGIVPDEYQSMFNFGHDAGVNVLSDYTNEGGKIEPIILSESTSNIRRSFKTFPKLYPITWFYAAYTWKYPSITQSKDAPNLYHGHAANYLGNEAQCGLFMLIEKDATNIRIKKGSGVLNLDGHTFAYSQRFTAEDEKIDLSFTYNK